MAEQLYVLRWQTPPEAKKRGGGSRRNLFAEAAEELRGMPGQWGVVFEGTNNRASGMASNINSGVYPCCRPPGSFEAVARMDAGVRTVFARYVGGKSQETA
jgi:hypothetical protein